MGKDVSAHFIDRRQKVTGMGTGRKRLNSGIGWARMMVAIIDLMQLKDEARVSEGA